MERENDIHTHARAHAHARSHTHTHSVVLPGSLLTAMLATSLVLCVALADSRPAVLSGALPSRAEKVVSLRSASLRLRGGAEPSEEVLQATFACNRLFASCLADANAEVSMLRKMVANAEDLSGFADKADAIISNAEEKFAAGTPSGSQEIAELFAGKKAELVEAVLTSIEPSFVRALSALKETCLEAFKASAVGQDDLSEAMSSAEATFVRGAKACVPARSTWGYKTERAGLVSVMEVVKMQAKKAAQAKQTAQQQINTAMNYLQLQSQQMQQIQQQYAGGQGGKWSVGAAYRPPESNINLSGTYQQGRANFQLSMVPDEGAALLGPNGFTNGVGPANLGLSMNVHL
mmetsp:Transcript_30541/g.83660  ORF Transcript_30541/g.83660 Transcript_30541/m.83660 type:complete len:348 (+) Transcript_30541:300-1343(+)